MKVMINAAAHELISKVMGSIDFKTIFIGDPIDGVVRGPDNGGDTLVVGICPCGADYVLVDETTLTPLESKVPEWRTYPSVTSVDELVKAYNAVRVKETEARHNDDAFEGLLRQADSDVSSAVDDILPDVAQGDHDEEDL